MKCEKHPRYKAIRQPRVDCDDCWEIYGQGKFFFTLDSPDIKERENLRRAIKKNFSLGTYRYGSGNYGHAQMDFCSPVNIKPQVRKFLRAEFPKSKVV